MFGSEAWECMLDEKGELLQPKSENYILVRNSKHVKVCIFLQPHFNEVIIRRNICEPNAKFLP